MFHPSKIISSWIKDMKRKVFLISVILLCICLTGIGIFFVIRDKENMIIEEEKSELALLYRRQNTALKACLDLSKMDYYHGADEIDLKNFYIELYVYNYTRTKYQLTVDEVLDYLSEEYDVNGNLRVYSQPENIKDYIGWEIHIGHEMADNFRGYFIDYLKINSNKSLTEMSYEELVDALGEYQNSSEFIPPGQKK